MNAPQIIRTPSGEELVVLPRAEYAALLDRVDHEAEDADNVAIYDAPNRHRKAVFTPQCEFPRNPTPTGC
jgi:hypothetical protein